MANSKNSNIVVYPTDGPNLNPIPPKQPEVEPRTHLDLSRTKLELYQESVDLLDSEGFALIRRNGFGGSDSSVLCGVNPYTTLDELIQQKASTTVSEEEKAIGQNVAVIKGNELEPLILHKAQQILATPVLKPTDMYRFVDYPWLTMNFDGVVDQGDAYVPAEAKVVTKKGERHYDPLKTWFDSLRGFGNVPEDHSQKNISIETKAALYGIPAYYYTQVQQEMLALDAPYGYLFSLWDNIWAYRVFFIWRDTAVQNAIIINGGKAWDRVEKLKNHTQKPPL